MGFFRLRQAPKQICGQVKESGGRQLSRKKVRSLPSQEAVADPNPIRNQAMGETFLRSPLRTPRGRFLVSLPPGGEFLLGTPEFVGRASGESRLVGSWKAHGLFFPTPRSDSENGELRQRGCPPGPMGSNWASLGFKQPASRPLQSLREPRGREGGRAGRLPGEELRDFELRKGKKKRRSFTAPPLPCLCVCKKLVLLQSPRALGSVVAVTVCWVGRKSISSRPTH